MTRKNYKLTIQYDGSDFHGWQIQAKGRTVQGDIENALSVIYPGETITLIGAGRTDAGVHALGQVAHISLPLKHTAAELQKALNGNLKHDVRIDMVEDADDDFHARFSATAREYEYHMVKHFSPVTRNHTTLLKWKVDRKLLKECADVLTGEHDFTSFCKATAEVDHKLCIVHSAGWEESTERLIFKVRANRFLQHMVRIIAGTLVEVGRGYKNVEDVAQALESGQRKQAGKTAPGHGLYSLSVIYPEGMIEWPLEVLDN